MGSYCWLCDVRRQQADGQISIYTDRQRQPDQRAEQSMTTVPALRNAPRPRVHAITMPRPNRFFTASPIDPCFREHDEQGTPVFVILYKWQNRIKRTLVSGARTFS
jgi:hypothetical protein